MSSGNHRTRNASYRRFKPPLDVKFSTPPLNRRFTFEDESGFRKHKSLSPLDSPKQGKLDVSNRSPTTRPSERNEDFEIGLDENVNFNTPPSSKEFVEVASIRHDFDYVFGEVFTGTPLVKLIGTTEQNDFAISENSSSKENSTTTTQNDFDGGFPESVAPKENLVVASTQNGSDGASPAPESLKENLVGTPTQYDSDGVFAVPWPPKKKSRNATSQTSESGESFGAFRMPFLFQRSEDQNSDAVAKKSPLVNLAEANQQAAIFEIMADQNSSGPLIIAASTHTADPRSVSSQQDLFMSPPKSSTSQQDETSDDHGESPLSPYRFIGDTGIMIPPRNQPGYDLNLTYYLNAKRRNSGHCSQESQPYLCAQRPNDSY